MLATTEERKVEVTLPSDREIVFTRMFSRTAGQLFNAWTTPEHMRRWWGCDESEVTACEADLRVGGRWHVIMKMPDGRSHSFNGVYQEIVPYKRLVYTERYENPQFGNPDWVTTVTFEPTSEGTLLTHRILHHSREVRDGHLQSGMEEGSKQSLNRLDKEAAAIPANKTE